MVLPFLNHKRPFIVFTLSYSLNTHGIRPLGFMGSLILMLSPWHLLNCRLLQRSILTPLSLATTPLPSLHLVPVNVTISSLTTLLSSLQWASLSTTVSSHAVATSLATSEPPPPIIFSSDKEKSSLSSSSRHYIIVIMSAYHVKRPFDTYAIVFMVLHCLHHLIESTTNFQHHIVNTSPLENSHDGDKYFSYPTQHFLKNVQQDELSLVDGQLSNINLGAQKALLSHYRSIYGYRQI